MLLGCSLYSDRCVNNLYNVYFLLIVLDEPVDEGPAVEDAKNPKK